MGHDCIFESASDHEGKRRPSTEQGGTDCHDHLNEPLGAITEAESGL
jgi:hypothetical protein